MTFMMVVLVLFNFIIFVHLKKNNKSNLNNMNLHEYQSKEILAKYGVNIQRGFIANNVDEAEAASKEVNPAAARAYPRKLDIDRIDRLVGKARPQATA